MTLHILVTHFLQLFWYCFRTYNNQFLYDDFSSKGEAERIREIDDFSNSMEDLGGLSNLTNSVNNDIPGAFNSSISN